MEVTADEVLRKYGVRGVGKMVPLAVDPGGAGYRPIGCKRRARTREQGMALVMVGHAIEYLVDSRAGSQDEAAVKLLVEANRATYEEGKEIVPFGMRLKRLFPRIAVRRDARSKRHASR